MIIILSDKNQIPLLIDSLFTYIIFSHSHDTPHGRWTTAGKAKGYLSDKMMTLYKKGLSATSNVFEKAFL